MDFRTNAQLRVASSSSLVQAAGAEQETVYRNDLIPILVKLAFSLGSESEAVQP